MTCQPFMSLSPLILDNLSFNYSFQSSIKLILWGEYLFTHCWTLWAVKCVPWFEEMTVKCPNWCNIFFSNHSIILEHLYSYLLLDMQSPVQSQYLFLSRFIYTLQGSWPAMLRTFSPGNLQHSHLQSFSLLLANWIICIGILCLRGYNRNMSRFGPSLHCCSTLISTHFMEPVDHLKQADDNICFSIPNTFWPWREFWRV